MKRLPCIAKALRAGGLSLYAVNFFLHVFFFKEILFRTNVSIYLYSGALLLFVAALVINYKSEPKIFRENSRWESLVIIGLAVICICLIISRYYFTPKVFDILMGK